MLGITCKTEDTKLKINPGRNEAHRDDRTKQEKDQNLIVTDTLDLPESTIVKDPSLAPQAKVTTEKYKRSLMIQETLDLVPRRASMLMWNGGVPNMPVRA